MNGVLLLSSAVTSSSTGRKHITKINQNTGAIQQAAAWAREVPSRAMQRSNRMTKHPTGGRSYPQAPSHIRNVPAVKGPAAALDQEQVAFLFTWIETYSPIPESDRLKFALSHYAGLRVSEIASLRLAHVTDPQGRLSKVIRITSENSKSRRERSIPMHPMIAGAITAYRKAFPDLQYFAISRMWGKVRQQSVNALTVYMREVYRSAGLARCSSHTGRRTMITHLARTANQVGASLRDVQMIAGHARIDTTERYIEPSKNLVDLINLVGVDTTSRRAEHERGGETSSLVAWVNPGEGK
jgi:integrase